LHIGMHELGNAVLVALLKVFLFLLGSHLLV
jgi:hypothetical protein